MREHTYKAARLGALAAALPLLLAAPVLAQHEGHGAGHAPAERGPSIAAGAHHGPDAASSMPKIAPSRVVTVTGDEDWDALTGFGPASPFVAMMNLMMVGGSGYEHMRMAGVKPEDHQKAHPPADPADPMGFMNSHVGSRDRMVSGAPSVGGAPDAETGHATPAAPAVPRAEPEHAHTPVEPPKPAEVPQAETDASRAAPTAPVPAPPAPKPAVGPSVTATIGAPKVGKNVVEIHVSGADGAPLPGAKVTAEVNMTNMDMGTARPTVTEVSPGRYRATVNFSMRGPWRVILRVTPKAGAAFTKAFDFRVP